MMNRRDVLGLAVSAGAASVFLPRTARCNDTQNSKSFRIVDSNVSLFHWPFRRLPLDESAALIKKLRSLGIAEAWAGSFEGVLHRDIAGVNQRLVDSCTLHTELTPIGSVNPTLPDWEEDLRRCVQDHKMPGIRLHPNYHGYTLDDPRFFRLVELATKAGCFIQLAVAMEDTRTQHPMLRVADVDLAPLPSVTKKIAAARIQILNHRLRSPLLEQLANSPGVCFDTSRVDSTDGIPTLVKKVSVSRVMFGSHAPFLIPEAALIRTHESGTIELADLRTVLAVNADAFGKVVR
jgi:predicted TIM-barrel fold metal-dependent hydrolase